MEILHKFEVDTELFYHFALSVIFLKNSGKKKTPQKCKTSLNSKFATLLRGAPPNKNRIFLGDFSQMCLTPKQGPSPSIPPQITPKIDFFDLNFTFSFPKSHKNPRVGGWENTFGRDWGVSP